MDRFASLARELPVAWWDVLDILVVAFIVYEVLRLIRGTRAVQMAVGSVLIAVLFLASRVLPLPTVNWLIRNIFGYVVFAAIVIFQSDIRRALAHFGRAPLLRRLTRTQAADETVEELVVAASTLSDKRTGAIIVVERAIGLRNYIESGIPLDATITHDLLVSVFQLASPLHDGAVIIQDERVAAAACFLPLTVNPALSRELGARHRAAIGLTEETDAVAVIVSERTGAISLALEGSIERNISPAQLSERLRALVTVRRVSRDGRERNGSAGR
jgi:diadenylate cyclase